jgi:hypothetical protein
MGTTRLTVGCFDGPAAALHPHNVATDRIAAPAGRGTAVRPAVCAAALHVCRAVEFRAARSHILLDEGHNIGVFEDSGYIYSPGDSGQGVGSDPHLHALPCIAAHCRALPTHQTAHETKTRRHPCNMKCYNTQGRGAPITMSLHCTGCVWWLLLMLPPSVQCITICALFQIACSVVV